MTDLPSQPSPRRYGDVEVRRLLERATELQQEEGTRTSGGRGLTLPELEEIAAEAGIDPAHLRRAARELDEDRPPSGGGWAWVTGEPVTLRFERTVPGEVPDATLEGLVLEIQRSEGILGQPSLLGRTLTWHAVTPNNARTLEVVVSSRRGETRIRIEERLNQLAGGLFGGLMGGAGVGGGLGIGLGVGLGALGSGLFAALFPVAALGGTYALARGIFTGVARSRRRSLGELMERLVEIVSDRVEEGPPEHARLPGGEPADRRLSGEASSARVPEGPGRHPEGEGRGRGSAERRHPEGGSPERG